MLTTPPGVYRPQRDTHFLAEAFRRERLPTGAKVLDVCTGSGALAMLAASAGAGGVDAVDICPRAVAAARMNVEECGFDVRVLRGDLFTPVSDRWYDLILANPPYVPTMPAGRVGSTPNYDARWDGGLDGRAVVNRLCNEVCHRLRPRGVLLLVQSALCGVSATVDALQGSGLQASVVDRCFISFGPVLSERAGWLEHQGLVRSGQREEELVVIRAQRTA